MDRRDRRERDEDAAALEAAGWVLRVESPDATEADWLALRAWLESSPRNRDAFDRVQAVASEFAASAPELLLALKASRPSPGRRPAASRRTASGGRRPWRAWAGAAAAAAAAVLVVAIQLERPAPPEVFATDRGEQQTVALADGSRIHLNGGSRISVRFGGGARDVELAEGEAAFDVAEDADRPFVIVAGDRNVRVVGTEFSVLREEGRLRVSVRSGVVSVEPPGSMGRAEAVILKAGDQLDHRPAQHLSVVRRIDPEAAFAWRTGNLVYQDEPLGEIVTDLNRHFATPVQVVGPAAGLRFSGVIRIDSQDAVVRRLEAFLPVRGERQADAIVLRMRAG